MKFACVALFLIAVNAISIYGPSKRDTYAVKDKHHVPRLWKRIRPAPEQHVLNLQIGLKQSRFDELERHLYEGETCSAAALP